MLAHSLFFYFFSTITVFSALMVIVSRNTVYSVFFLISVFISISILFIMIGAEFLGMIMLIVYVGAVAVLFLFVVMMLNVTQPQIKLKSKKKFINNISVGSIVGIIIFLELLIVIGGWKHKDSFIGISGSEVNNNLTNTHAIGSVLYTEYIHLFQISGMILLVSMIGAITLTFTKREDVKRQNYFKQIQRDKEGGVKLIDVENNKGVILDD
ncbi:NADH-quinone oxidoreductase subunit J [Pelagibacteraceae bacterium]|jgi:NADH-quinone oxidoreductase subunit J|nr:NADH-quinone oxidoreductase subunit J [Pelagibacteraceae bacterium]